MNRMLLFSSKILARSRFVRSTVGQITPFLFCLPEEVSKVNSLALLSDSAPRSFSSSSTTTKTISLPLNLKSLSSLNRLKSSLATEPDTGVENVNKGWARTPLRPWPSPSDHHRDTTPLKPVPDFIRKPPYARTGRVPASPQHIRIHDVDSIRIMRRAAQTARRLLDQLCQHTVEVTTHLAFNTSSTTANPTTDDLDTWLHETMIHQEKVYPSPLNYAGFPRSVCTSINEVICHGIPDHRPLQIGDVLSLDVSCFTADGVHGDNCATLILGVPPALSSPSGAGVKIHGTEAATTSLTTTVSSTTSTFTATPPSEIDPQLHQHLQVAQRLVQAAQESLQAGVEACRPGACLSNIGAAIHHVADAYGYTSVEKYRGHGLAGPHLHMPPYVKHLRNDDRLELQPGMIFTIEPMICQYAADCFEWPDNWTVATVDGGLSAQFEHTVLITNTGVEVLTVNDG